MTDETSLGPPTVAIDQLSVHYRTSATSPRGTAGRLKRALRTTLNRTHPVTVVALDNVSLIAREGESVGVIGKNGSGKSTLLRAVAGFTPATSGAVYTSGSARLLGVNAALLPDLSGERNVVIGGLAQGMSSREVSQHMAGITDLAAIGDAIHRPMRTYSAGMGARLRFAIATATTPTILLVDEALATGDTEFRDRSEQRIRALREEAGTIFFVSHSLGAVEQTCQRTIWLDEGLIRMDGPTAQVVTAYRHYYAHRKLHREGERADEPIMPGPLLGPVVPADLVQPASQGGRPPGPRHGR